MWAYNCFGAHTYAHSPHLLPKNAIIYNLEQLYEGSPYAHLSLFNVIKR